MSLPCHLSALTLQQPHPLTCHLHPFRYRPNYGYTVTARSALLELVLYSTPKQFDPVVQEIARAHLNFELAANLEALSLTKCHGVLGQTAERADSTLIPDELSVRPMPPTCVPLTCHAFIMRCSNDHDAQCHFSSA